MGKNEKDENDKRGSSLAQTSEVLGAGAQGGLSEECYNCYKVSEETPLIPLHRTGGCGESVCLEC